MKHLPHDLQDPPFDEAQVAWLQRWITYWRIRARLLAGVVLTFVIVVVAGTVGVVIEKEQLRDSIRQDVGVAVVCTAEDAARTLVQTSFAARRQTGRPITQAERAQAQKYVQEQRDKAERRVASLLHGREVKCGNAPLLPSP